MQIGQNSYVPVPVPVPNTVMGAVSRVGRGSYQNGKKGLAWLYELATPLTVLGVVAMGVAVREYMRPCSEKLASAGQCQEKYCGNGVYQIHVDRPMHTLLKDQSLGAGLGENPPAKSLALPYAKVKSDYAREQMLSPGVKLVCDAISTPAYGDYTVEDEIMNI